jgi:diaminopimelate epimerase
MGNPQCILLDQPFTLQALQRFGPALQTHSEFPAGVNVEILAVDDPRRIRILIWERGVGPTQSSGTGSCASAVAAITHAGAQRAVDVVAPGGTQRVEWAADDEVYLTGWAEIVLDGQWLR